MNNAKSNSTCRRQIFVFCIFFMTTIIAHAQTAEWKKSLSLGKSSLENRFRFYIKDATVFYFTTEDWDESTRMLKVSSLETTSSKRDSFIVSIPETVIFYDLPEIALNDDFLIMTDEEKMDIYRFWKTGNTYKFLNKIILPPHTNGQFVSFLKKNLFLVQCLYNFHPLDSTNNTNLGIYDAATDKILNFIHPDLPCIGFTHLDMSYVTNSDNLIAVANPCGYKIVLYDFNLKAKDSIDYTPKTGWTALPGNKIPGETDPSKIHPKLLIDNLVALKDSVSIIEKIFFINNDYLLISATGKSYGDNNRRIDYWNIKNSKSPAYSFPKAKIYYNENDTIQLKKCPLILNECKRSIIHNNLIYTLNDDDFFPEDNQLFKIFNNKKNIYYEDNTPNFSVSIYRINLQ